MGENVRRQALKIVVPLQVVWHSRKVGLPRAAAVRRVLLQTEQWDDSLLRKVQGLSANLAGKRMQTFADWLRSITIWMSSLFLKLWSQCEISTRGKEQLFFKDAVSLPGSGWNISCGALWTEETPWSYMPKERRPMKFLKSRFSGARAWSFVESMRRVNENPFEQISRREDVSKCSGLWHQRAVPNPKKLQIVWLTFRSVEKLYYTAPPQHVLRDVDFGNEHLLSLTISVKDENGDLFVFNDFRLKLIDIIYTISSSNVMLSAPLEKFNPQLTTFGWPEFVKLRKNLRNPRNWKLLQ